MHECFHLTLQILILLAFGFYCISDLVELILQLLPLQGIHIFLKFLLLSQDILVIILQPSLEAVEPVDLPVALLNNHPQALALLPLRCQLLHQACTPQPLLLYCMHCPFLSLLHCIPGLPPLTFQLIGEGDNLPVQFLIGATDFQEISLECCDFPPEGVALSGCPFGTGLEGAVLVDESVDIGCGVGRLDGLLSPCQLLQIHPHVLKFTTQVGIFFAQFAYLVEQLLVLLGRGGEGGGRVVVEGEVEERFAGSHGFDFGMFIKGEDGADMLSVALTIEGNVVVDMVFVPLEVWSVHQEEVVCFLVRREQLWLRRQLSIHINLFAQRVMQSVSEE